MKKVFALFLFFLLLLSVSSAENVSSVRILCTDYNYSAFQDYAAAGHDVNFRNGSINDIATALASRDPDIDVFVFQTRSGLDQIKKQHYYYPLTDASDLMDKLGDLYPAFQNASWTMAIWSAGMLMHSRGGGKFFPLICWKNWHFPHQQPLMSC